MYGDGIFTWYNGYVPLLLHLFLCNVWHEKLRMSLCGWSFCIFSLAYPVKFISLLPIEALTKDVLIVLEVG